MQVQSTPEASQAPVSEEVQPIAEATPAAPVSEDQPPVEGAPAESGTSGEEILERFKLEDVPEEYREDVGRYVKQAQGDYTRKTMELAEQRRTVEAEAEQIKAIRETFDKLESEDTRDEAVMELVQKYGYTFEEAEAEAEEATDSGEVAEFRDPRVDQILAQQEADQQAAADAQAAADGEAFRERIMDHVDDALDAYAETEGIQDGIPAAQRRQIIAIAASLPRLEGDLPDMETAIAEFDAEKAAIIEGYLASKRGTVPDVSGSTGAEKFDPRDSKQRLAAANRIAESALARHR